jgi:hypothetical protein
MAKMSATTAALMTFLSVLIYGIILDWVARNYPGLSPILAAAIAAAIGAYIMYMAFGKKAGA